MSHKESDTKNDDISHYRRTCNFTPSKFNTEIKKTKFKLPGDKMTLSIFDVVMNENRTQLRAEFDDNSLYENKRMVSFQGPSLFSKCKISGVQKENFHREFGYIQTSKILFVKEFDETVVYCDFHANLLHGLDEVLDSDLENYPFYSRDSYYKVPANITPPNEIDLYLSDCPSSETLKRFDCSSIETLSISDRYSEDEYQISDIEKCSLPSTESANKTLQNENNVRLPVNPSSATLKSLDCSCNETSLKRDFGCLKKQETYQQFFVYLVMRSKKKVDEEWKYDVLFSFDWFIYLKWTKVTDINNNIFEYNCGLNEHDTVQEFPKFMEYYSCNDDQFEYWIDGENINLYLDKYPNSIFKNKLNTIYENIKNFISKTKELYKKLENKDSEEEKKKRIRTLNLDENDFFENSGNISLKVKKLCESMLTVNSIKDKIYNFYKYLCKSEEAKTNNIGSKVQRLHEIIIEMDNEIENFSINYKETAVEINELYNNFKGNDSVDDKIYEDIENLLPDVYKLSNNFKQMDLIKNKFHDSSENLDANIASMNNVEKDIYEDIENLFPKIENITKYIEEEYLIKYEFSENFRYMALEMKRLYELMKFLDWEKNKFRERYKNIVSVDNLKYTENTDSESLNALTESLIMKFEEIFKDDKIDLEKFKFCKCNNLSTTEFCAKIKQAIIDGNKKEKVEKNHQNDDHSVTGHELQVDKKMSLFSDDPGIIQDKNQRINEACSSEIL